MQKISMVSHDDWVKMGAGLNTSCNATLDLYTMLANSLGKSHSDTKKALAVYNKLVCLKSDMHQLAKENASGMFGQKELDGLFPSGIKIYNRTSRPRTDAGGQGSESLTYTTLNNESFNDNYERTV